MPKKKNGKSGFKIVRPLSHMRTVYPHFIHPFSDETRTYMHPYGIAGVSGCTSANTRCCPAPLSSDSADGRKSYFSIRLQSGSEEHGQTVRVPPIPHRGERRSDRAVPAQCAGPALSSACSAGENGAIPAEQRINTGRINTDPSRVKGAPHILFSKPQSILKLLLLL